MEKEVEKWLNIIFQITIVIFALIPAYFVFKTTPKEITAQALIIFGIIIGVFVLTIIFSFIYSKYKSILGNIISNKTEISEIKKDLKFKEIFNNMEKRLLVMEKLFDKLIPKKKKGQFGIDPRIILWLLLLILLYLFLRSMGIL